MSKPYAPVKVADITFKNPLLNGAYIHSKTLDDVEALANSASGGVVVGSISIKARKPNPGTNYFAEQNGLYSLNSYGLPNGGLKYFKENLPKMVEVAHRQGKPLIANIVGFSSQEWHELIKLAEVSDADLVELNFGCPNVWDNGKQKQILSYHPALIKETLDYLSGKSYKIGLGIKLSPLPPDILSEVAKVTAGSGIVKFVTATNSYPNAAIAGNNVLAGLSGSALKPISLGMVKQLRAQLPNNVDIIGCGGISSADDARDYLTAGCQALEVATALMNEGLSVFDRL